MSEEWPDYMTDADQLDERFLAEVERRAGASREEMLKSVDAFAFDEPEQHAEECAYSRFLYNNEPKDDACSCSFKALLWLRRILGEKP